MRRSGVLIAALFVVLAPRALWGDEVPGEDATLASGLRGSAAAHAASGERQLAFRDYARAVRWDPTKTAPLNELPDLAGRVGLNAAAARYGAIAAREGLTRWAKPATVRRLAGDAAERGEHADAATLWELAHRLATRPDRRWRAALRAASAWYLAEEPTRASAWFTRATAAGGAGYVDTLDRPAAIWEGVVACHLEAGRLDAAEPVASSLVDRGVEPQRAALWSGRVALAAGRPAEAYEAAKRSLRGRADGANEEALTLLRESLLAMNGADRAPDELRGLLKDASAPRRAAIRLAIVDAFGVSERYDAANAEAAALVETLLESPDEETGAILAEAAGRRVELLAAKGDAASLWELLPRLADRWGSLEPIAETLSSALTGAPLRELARVWLATREPGSMAPAELAAAGRVAIDVGEVTIAGDFYRPLIRLAAEHDASADAAMAAAWLGGWVYDLADRRAWDELVAALDWAEQSAPTAAAEFDSKYLRALALNALARHEEALAVIADVDSADRTDPYFVELEATALADVGRTTEAIALVKAALATRRSLDSETAVTRLRTSLSHLYDRRGEEGDHELGDEQLERVLDENPGHANANNDLAYRWAERGLHLERSLRMARVAVAARPDSSAYADTLGWVLHLLGRHEEAVVELRRSVEMLAAETTTDDDAVLYLHLAAALDAVDDSAAAEAARREATRLSGEPPIPSP